MRTIVGGAVAAVLCVALSGSVGFAGGTAVIDLPGSIKWSPGTGALKGTEMAVLAGDPSKAGSAYTLRLRIPDGAKFPAHFHGDAENITVISGTFLVGVGEKYDVSKLTAVPAGGFVSLPAGLHHFATVKGTTVLELHGTGPFAMTMVKGHM